MNTNSPDRTNYLADELSLLDIVQFIQESWKTIVGITALGIAGAVIFFWVVPKQFEASAQVKMAQIANFNSSSINPLGINIEDPQSLIARMALPTSYPKETISLCGLTDKKYADTIIAKKVKLSILKGVSGTVELKIRDASKEIAKECTNAVYQLIKTSQTRLIAPYIDAVTKKLKIEEQRLSRATQVIAEADKSGGDVSAAYLATRDEIRHLLDQISNLQSILASNEGRTAQLTAPIYVKDEPVFPQMRDSLLIGLLLGGFLGLMLPLVRKWYRSNRAALG